MTTPTYRIEPLRLPETLDAADAGTFLEFGELCDALVLQTWGNLDRATPAEARLRYWRDTAYQQTRLFYVRVDGRMVARAWIRFDLQENLRSALGHVQVLPAFAGRGIGRSLLRHTEALALADGRTILQTFTEHPADYDVDGPGVLRPLTGTGAVPENERGVQFARRAGYRLEQVERFSSLDVRAAAGVLDGLEQEALAKSGGYELLFWADRCPDEHVGQLARLMSRMSTDAPAGGLSIEEEVWDAARVRHVEDTWRRAGNDALVVAARHRDSGELAAYTVLELARSKPWLADQDDTLVAAAHRGHRLGMLVKIANIRRLLELYPAVQRVNTYNAAENGHMLAINVALGFKPAGYDGEWQRTAVGDPALSPD